MHPPPYASPPPTCPLPPPPYQGWGWGKTGAPERATQTPPASSYDCYGLPVHAPAVGATPASGTRYNFSAVPQQKQPYSGVSHQRKAAPMYPQQQYLHRQSEAAAPPSGGIRGTPPFASAAGLHV
eukprot:TRINITY_DN1014_c0_g2_i3.p2 TRINITY_DN1014_c0_g2~~TRINITY_DN1014_c0_g2_i3.p2  ORF type:complete len:125 (+),score=12.96 TRINITY_DN1014_c0_g2_i3:435-809(+)